MSPNSVTFDGRTYTNEALYPFDDLPDEVKEDLWRQEEGLELAYGRGRKKLRYRFVIVPHKRLVECLERLFGSDLKERMSEDDITDLAYKISKFGLKHPPVEGEGYHRAMALALLGWPMPYFEVAETPAHPLPALCRSDKAGLPRGRKQW